MHLMLEQGEDSPLLKQPSRAALCVRVPILGQRFEFPIDIDNARALHRLLKLALFEREKFCDTLGARPRSGCAPRCRR
jgi:hypothetical protein